MTKIGEGLYHFGTIDLSENDWHYKFAYIVKEKVKVRLQKKGL